MKLLRATPWHIIASRALLMLGLWWVLTEGSTDTLWFGVITAIAATFISLYAWPRKQMRWRLIPFLQFLPYFLWRSLLGGIDVARRAFTPKLPVQPTVRQYELKLRTEPAQAFLAWTITLSPGTASVNLENNRLDVHLLDPSLLPESRLRGIEARVGAMFNENLSPDHATTRKKRPGK